MKEQKIKLDKKSAELTKSSNFKKNNEKPEFIKNTHLTLLEAMYRTNLTYISINKLFKSGELKKIRYGRKCYVPIIDIEKYIKFKNTHLNMSETIRKTGLGYKAVQNLFKSGELKRIKRKRFNYVPITDIENYLKIKDNHLTMKEAMDKMKLSYTTIEKLSKSGEIKRVRYGRNYYLSITDIENYIKKLFQKND